MALYLVNNDGDTVGDDESGDIPERIDHQYYSPRKPLDYQIVNL